MLEELRETVDGMLQRQNDKLAQTVMAKLQLTLQTVEVIYTWMNQTVGEQMPPRAIIAVPQHHHAQALHHAQVHGQVNGAEPAANGAGANHSRVGSPLTAVNSATPGAGPSRVVPH